MAKSKGTGERRVIAEGRYLRLVDAGGWEWAERTKVSGIVVLAALTPAGHLLLVEQYRPPVGARVLELPAGLAGDIDADEALVTAARRELEEETGYTSQELALVAQGPVSAGMSGEIQSFFVARNLERIGPGGGDASEDIVVHEVPMDDLHSWLATKRAQGVLVDPKVFTGVYFLQP